MGFLTKIQTLPIVQTLLLVGAQPNLLWRMMQVQTLPTFQPFVALMTGEVGLAVVEQMSNGLLETSSFAPVVAHLKHDANCAAMIAERYMTDPHDLEALLQYPEDSLGYMYARHMQARGFRAEALYEGLAIDSDASYIEARLSHTHDIWHIVTGFGITDIEEIGLQAFHLPQFPYPLAISLISSAMMAAMQFRPTELPQLLETIRQGWEMGRRAKPLFAQRWEEGWHKPLAQWRAELNIQPFALGTTGDIISQGMGTSATSKALANLP
jgi:ubiquinone biosynthesis protein Coq4